jgi:hypothetical protein
MGLRLNASQKIRKANRHFFEESGLRSNKPQKQHPYLILRPTKTRVNLDLAHTAEELLELPDNTRVLAQWKGKKRSDFYSFKVGCLRKYLEENPRQPRQAI